MATKSRNALPNEVLGRLLLERRMSLGLHQNTLARRTGLSQQSINTVEQGGGAKWETVRRLARALHLSLASIERQLPDPDVLDLEAQNRHDRIITPTDAAEIRRKHKAGSTDQELATEYGVSESYINLIRTGKRVTGKV